MANIPRIRHTKDMSENKPEGYRIEGAETEELREKIKNLMRHEKRSAVMNDIAEFAHALREKYSAEELHNYTAYCILIGSTPREEPDHFDFEGDESIVRFIDTLAEEMENEEKE